MHQYIFGSSGAQSSASSLAESSVHRGSHLSLSSLGSGGNTSTAAGSGVAIEDEEAAHARVIESLSEALQAVKVIPLLLAQLKSVDFETRKSVSSIFNHLVRNNVASFSTSYLKHSVNILYQLMDAYSSPDIALCCGAMLRECLRFHAPRNSISPSNSVASSLSRSQVRTAVSDNDSIGSNGISNAQVGVGILDSSEEVHFLHEAFIIGPDGGISQPMKTLFEEHVHNPNFEVAADAFETLSTLLTTNKSGICKYFNPDLGEAEHLRYVELFSMFNEILQSDNYVLKRQGLKLLGEFLLDRDNFSIMMRYICDMANMKIIMGMLRHKQPNIQFEAFHVFKIFVANPKKPEDISDILACNKQKLITFLQSFQNDKDDTQFADEKRMLICALNRLPEKVIAQPSSVTASVLVNSSESKSAT
jgi:hypothetical protein